MRARFWMLALALCVATAGVASAQVQSGSVSGAVRDAQGGVLPGVTVTLAGNGPTQTYVTEGDGQYRFLNVPPGTYTVTANLQGFQTVIREGVVVAVGQSVALPMTLNLATVQETVTVTGESPVIDAKAMGTATNFTQDELSRVPNSRDPWALLRTVPGVSLDRVNIAGNETGQQSSFVAKGSRQGDAVWTMDGVPITDMATNGASPTYFDYDAFDEIQISTGGNDIRQATGGVGLNFVVKRGTNQFRGTARGYYTGEELEATNVPDELLARGVTADTADHNQQITDVGVDFGGPAVKDRLFFWGSIGQQDIRLYRQSARGTDRTILKTYNAKVNWQATSKDMVNFLFFNGDKIKNGRAPGNALFEPASARWDQGNYYTDNPLHGLWKLEDNRVMSSNWFLSGKYAYYNTGFTLNSIGPFTEQMGISPLTGQTYGSTNGNFFARPQHTVNVDSNYFKSLGNATHDFKFGGGWRKTDIFSQTLYPGNGIVAYENSATNFRARVYREGAGTNRAQYLNFYIGDTVSFDRLTLDLGLRYDRQWGEALASNTQSNSAFPNLVPGIEFAGYDAAVPLERPDPAHRHDLRARRGAQDHPPRQLQPQRRPADRGRHLHRLRQPELGRRLGRVSVDRPQRRSPGADQRSAGQPAAARLGRRLQHREPDLGVVREPDRSRPQGRVEHRLHRRPRSRADSQPGAAGELHLRPGHQPPDVPFIGITTADWAQFGTLAGTTPDGVAYNLPLFQPDGAIVGANGGGRFLTNFDGYYTMFNGIELSMTKRMSNRWQMRLATAWNNPTEGYDDGMVPVSENGNPTRSDIFPLTDGGQWAPRSAGSGSGDVFVNQRWSFNVNGVYQLPWEMEVAGNVFGKQGTPYPYFLNQSLGREGTTRILVTPELDAQRFENLWNVDLRWAKNARFGDRGTFQFTMDLFNVFNSNTEITRERNAAATTFRVLGSNLSPRILRFGVRLGL